MYALLFTDHGMSPWQLSSLLVIWSATGILIEVPSGALADASSRRLLLVIGPLLTAAGFGLWVYTPSYAAFAAGFVLWGVKARSPRERSKRCSTRNWTGSGTPRHTRD